MDNSCSNFINHLPTHAAQTYFDFPAFENVEDYLDIQFRLLREDFVATIREGIKAFKKNPSLRGPERFRSGDVKVYENFTVLVPIFGQNGMNYVVQ